MIVNLDPIDYDIKFVKNPNYDEEDIFGYIDSDNCVIQIKDDLNITRKKIVLLHELLHAMLMRCGLNLKEEDNDLYEQIIECLSHSLYSMIKNNPELMKYLMDEKQKRKK